mmetsp:Transcript_15452/g.27987  ORF Transcript_15452/g.27987 Transcript_15452/m.27987 type:complete len:188 (+) Transcript_15452:1128-1691(+)
MLTDISFREGEAETFDDYRYANYKELTLVDLVSQPIRITQDFRLGKGGILWDAAYLLSKYILSLGLEGKKVLELGAGCGLCSIVAAAAGAEVWATDIHPALQLTHKNKELNSEICQQLTVVKLDWDSQEDREALTEEFDLILMSDLFYIIVTSTPGTRPCSHSNSSTLQQALYVDLADLQVQDGRDA